MKIVLAFASYLLGSIPAGYLIVRWAGHKDVREFGSRSTGATNVLRVKGWKTAVPVAAFDILKGFLPAFLALRLFDDPVLAAFCGLLAVVGHCFPFAIGFRGGKGVATSLGAYAALSLAPLLASLGLFLITIGLSGYVSLGSILGSIAYPLVLLISGGPKGVVAVCSVIAALVIFQHRGNIKRLAKGTERKLGEKAS